jgi:hypothetical protein
MNPVAPWADYFVGLAGASAALTGLIFVVLSFNFNHIVGDRVWLGRAGTGLILLAQPTIYSLIGLIPTRTAEPVAWALALTAVIAGTSLARIVLSTTGRPAPGEAGELIGRIGSSLGASVFAAAGAFGLAAGWSGGLFLLAAGSLASLALGLVVAWVLLVEVRRLETSPESSRIDLPGAARPGPATPSPTHPACTATRFT